MACLHEETIMKIVKRLLLPLLLLASSLLHAHTELASATPADGAVLHAAPAAQQLAFTEEVQLLKLVVTDAAGKAVETGFQASATAQKAFTLALPALPPAAYKVSWTLLGKDGHRVEGSLGFTVDPNATETTGGAATHEHHGNH
jgi:methionine-rich copper-binding protein CopC